MRGEQSWCGRRLAAHGSSGLVEESAQDGELEERVERHVVICADGQARQASVRAGEGWWAMGRVPWAERVRLLGASVRFSFRHSSPKANAATPCNGSKDQNGGDIGHVRAASPKPRTPHPLIGAAWCVASGGVNVPLTKTQSARDSSPPTPNTTSNTRRNGQLTPHTRETP